MTKNANPFAAFDLTKMTADFDPTKMADEFMKVFGTMQIPNLDMGVVVESQKKNIEALTKANQAAVDGVRALAERQNAILNETLKEAKAAADALGKVKSPQDATAKQAEIAKKAFENALTNMRELAELVATSNEKSAETINTRIAESLDEIKSLALKFK